MGKRIPLFHLGPVMPMSGIERRIQGVYSCGVVSPEFALILDVFNEHFCDALQNSIRIEKNRITHSPRPLLRRRVYRCVRGGVRNKGMTHGLKNTDLAIRHLFA